MNNHISADLRTSESKNGSSHSDFVELRDLVQKQIAWRIQQVETYVQEHPATGIGAAFCIGILLGWIIKRK